MINLIKIALTIKITLISSAFCFGKDTSTATPQMHLASHHTTIDLTRDTNTIPQPAPTRQYRAIRPRFGLQAAPLPAPITTNQGRFIAGPFPTQLSTQITSNDWGKFTPSTPPLTGAKRPRSSRPMAQTPAPKKRRCATPKYAGVNFKDIKCWRIHPNEQGQVQFLDARGLAVCSRPVNVTGKALNLDKNYFCIYKYYFKRHPDDQKSLEENGFAPNQKPRVYDGPTIPFFVNGVDMASGTPHDPALDLKTPKCWRVHPTQKKRVQILNLEGKTICTVKVRKSKKLSHDYFPVMIKGKSYNLKQHPLDTADLEENGFAPNQKPRVYEGFEIPFIIENIVFNGNQLAMDAASEDFEDLQNTIPETSSMGLDAIFLESMNEDDTNNLRLSQISGSVDFSWLDESGTPTIDLAPAPSKKKKRKISTPKYAGVNFKAIKCWRIHPCEQGQVQFLDAQGLAVCSRPVNVTGKALNLDKNYFCIYKYYFKRHPDDQESLEENGFAPNQKPRVYEGPKIPFTIEDVNPRNSQLEKDAPSWGLELPQNIVPGTNDMDLGGILQTGINDVEEFLDDTNNLRLSQLSGSIDFSWLEIENPTTEITAQDLP